MSSWGRAATYFPVSIYSCRLPNPNATFFRLRSAPGALLELISIDFKFDVKLRCVFDSIWGLIGALPGPQNCAPAYTGSQIYTFRYLRFEALLGPFLGAFWGPLGGPFWLTSRLKIGQEPPRPLLDYFFSAPGPSPGPFGGPSGPFPGPLSRHWPKIYPRDAPRDPQMPPLGAQN